MLLLADVFILLLASTTTVKATEETLETRPNVISLGNDWGDKSVVFRSFSGNLYWSLSSISQQSLDGTEWRKVPLSSDIVVRSNSISITSDKSFLFIQTINGQVFTTTVTYEKLTPIFGKWLQVGGQLPYDEGSVIKGYDSITAKFFGGKIYVFARSYSNSSHLYWSAFDVNKISSMTWSMLGGSSMKLATDAAVAYNSFTKLLEAFAVSTDGYLYRSWQLSFSRWSSWDKTGYFAPKTIHAPVIHSMNTNIFNGRLNVFVHGTDGVLHHIWQTTCDKVPNPWGWCTWSVWYKISNELPITDASVANTLSIGNNIHLGIEVFVVDIKGKLYKMWQSKRHGSWSTWQLVQGASEYHISSLPAIVNNGTGWWSAYSFDSESNILVLKQNRSFVVSPPSLISGGLITVSWSMPIDEASHDDWIGVYPRGVSNLFYVDYVYVGGFQNPLSKIIPNGKVTFTTYLPQGSYDIRYLVNRRYVTAAGTTLVITKGPTDVDWVQIFKGIFTGLNIKGVDVKSCVKDAEAIPKAFLDAFTLFKDRAIYGGLKKLGKALGDVVKGINDCGIEKAFIDRIESFISDLVSCVSAKQCIHFLVDLGERILVLYENMYEIYGDIEGAVNSFKIKAYAQGGVNIGRVVGACIALPR